MEEGTLTVKYLFLCVLGRNEIFYKKILVTPGGAILL